MNVIGFSETKLYYTVARVLLDGPSSRSVPRIRREARRTRSCASCFARAHNRP